jgi:hypothetical protein
MASSSSGAVGGAGRSARIHAKIAAGELPAEPPERAATGFGQGESCNACDAIIRPVQLEYALEYADRRTFRMPHGCHRLWRLQLRRSPAD